MAWRKWLVRGLVFTVAGSLAAVALLYQRWTNPAAVRQQVLARFAEHLPGAVVSLETAGLRVLGGIAFRDLRLARADNPNAFLHVPSGVIYHDKEQLLQGRLAIRKIELDRPRLRIEFDKDGRCNLTGLLGRLRPDEPIPTIVVQHGTFVLEDRGPAHGLPPVEIHDVSLKILNDPLPTLLIEGAGRSDLTGPVRLSGSWQRISADFTCALQALAVPVGPPLVQRLAAYQPQLAEHVRQLEGTGRLLADFAHHPDRKEQPWSHDCRWQLTQGKFRHPDLPLPLDQVEMALRCLDGLVTVDRLTACAGPARVALERFTARLGPPGREADADLDGVLRVEHLPVTADLVARLPAGVREAATDYHPSGSLSSTVAFGRIAGQWRKHVILTPEGMSAAFCKFPYPVERIHGTLEVEFDPAHLPDRITVNLVGYHGPHPVYVRGSITGEKPAAVAIDISSSDVPLDDTLAAALQPEHRKLARAFDPHGLADFVVNIRRAQGAARFANRYLINFHHSTARYAVFPYPVEEISGTLDILPDHWEFRDFRGRHKGAEVYARGRSEPTPTGDRVSLEIQGSNVLLDEELEAALQPGLKQTWKELAPAGRLSFVARAEHAPGATDPDLDVSVQPVGCSFRPAFFPYGLDVVPGPDGEPAALVRYYRGEVTLKNLRARHGATALRLRDGTVYVKQGGGSFVNLADLEVSPLVPDADFYQALPPGLQRAFETLQLRQPIALRTRLTVDVPAEPERPPCIYWDGGAALGGANLQAGVPLEQVTGVVYCRGKHQGKLERVAGNVLLDAVTFYNQPFRNVHCQILVLPEEPEAVVLRGLRADVFGGQVGGTARIAFGATPGYEVDLTASQIRLEDFGRHNLGDKAQLSGLAAARLYLVGKGTSLDGLEGRGSFDVPSGKMYNLGPLLALLKALNKLQAPDRTAFEEAHARFTIHGQRVTITRLDLTGDAISLGGQGEMSLDANDVNLDFYAVLGRLPQLLPSPIKELPRAISEQLLKIKMTGPLSAPRISREPVPGLVEPVRELLERMSAVRDKVTR
jgi:hypothetical protein